MERLTVFEIEVETGLVTQQKLLERSCRRWPEATPLACRHQYGRFEPLPHDKLGAVLQAFAQKLAEPALGLAD